MKNGKFTGEERRAQIIYELDALGGLTLGKLAKSIKLSKTQTLAYLKDMAKNSLVWKCEVPNGDRGKFTKYVYFTTTRMARMLDAQPSPGEAYKVRQISIFEIIGELN